MYPRQAVPLLLALTLLLSSAARADQRYQVAGEDRLTIGARGVESQVQYSGRQTLVLARHGQTVTYSAQADYTRTTDGNRAIKQATFRSTLTPNGDQRDDENLDPDDLTILNQPFSIELDAPTLHDLAHLRAPEAFHFPAPMAGATLDGTLTGMGDATFNNERVLGVRFDATGPMQGALPGRTDKLVGRIRMSGNAYYRYRDALLMSLDATLTITGNLAGQRSPGPVTITYRRSIKALPPNAVRSARIP